ncbi:hydrolase [Ascochyta rabiei]|uniref:Hydrolase n=1 Tax=Didymella rabiei TaxID=5454 RepID=A0A163JHQ4_DIDRA|nr:hydrolase [Ascochyta rabiei]
MLRLRKARVGLMNAPSPSGEYPHIYVKKHTETLPDGQRASVLIVNDTGCGTSTRNHTTTTSQDWNIRTFIDHHLNPNRDDILYLVILSHCHYDHILGLEPLLHSPQRRNIAILSSSHDPAFLHPRSNLEQHSLCASMNLRCPVYRTSLWAAHDQHLTIPHPHLPTPLHLPLTTLHIPGHTPDSLAWYDAAERALYVGDALYERQSPESRAAPWGGEAPAPILFPGEGDLVAWWRSVHLLLGFVERRNAETACRCVTLSAGHVTVGVDAVACLLAVRRFMARVLRGEVEVREQPEKRGERFGYWVEEGGRFSLGAPLRVVGEGRVGIPEDEWREGGMFYQEGWTAVRLLVAPPHVTIMDYWIRGAPEIDASTLTMPHTGIDGSCFIDEASQHADMKSAMEVSHRCVV